MVIEEEELTKDTLVDSVRRLFSDRGSFIDAMRNSGQQDSIKTITGLIEEAAGGKIS